MALTLAGNGMITGTDWGASGGGLVKITTQSFSAASTVSVNNCFTSTYDNYRVVGSVTGASVAVLRFRLRAGGSDNSASSYDTAVWRMAANNTTATWASGTTTSSDILSMDSGYPPHTVQMDVIAPYLASYTRCAWSGACGLSGVSGTAMFSGALGHYVTGQFDGFTIYPSTGTITGTLTVYGYTK